MHRGEAAFAIGAISVSFLESFHAGGAAIGREIPANGGGDFKGIFSHTPITAGHLARRTAVPRNQKKMAPSTLRKSGSVSKGMKSLGIARRVCPFGALGCRRQVDRPFFRRWEPP